MATEENQAQGAGGTARQAPTATLTVECPCCHGETKLIALDADDNDHPVRLGCNHCADGTIPAEDPERPVVENNFVVAVPASLQRNEMTPNEKREHLRSLGVKDNADIEKIIGEIFP